jgi:hypothetical protein
MPVAICTQNSRSISLRSEGAPGERIAPRPVNFCIHPAGRPINTSIKVLRRPVESAIWQVEAGRSTYKKLDKRSVLYKAKRKIEKAKVQVRAKVEHPFRVIKRQFGYVKTRFRGLTKNTAQLVTLFALSNLWMARRHLLTNAGEVRL